jgi:hypothetical protein
MLGLNKIAKIGMPQTINKLELTPLIKSTKSLATEHSYNDDFIFI